MWRSFISTLQCLANCVLLYTWILLHFQVVSIKAIGIAIKLTLDGISQIAYPQTWFFLSVATICVITQLNYLNRVSDETYDWDYKLLFAYIEGKLCFFGLHLIHDLWFLILILLPRGKASWPAFDAWFMVSYFKRKTNQKADLLVLVIRAKVESFLN